MWSLIISTVVYCVADWGAARFLTQRYGLEKGFPRRVLAFMFACVVSWMASSVIDWIWPSPSILDAALGMAIPGAPGLGGAPGGMSTQSQDAQATLNAMAKALAQP